MLQDMRKWLDPYLRQIQLLISTGKTGASSFSDGRISGTAQLLPSGNSAEVVKIIHHQLYGFASVPPEDCPALVAFPGGVRGNGICIAIGDAPPIAEIGQGDVHVYTRGGSRLSLRADGSAITLWLGNQAKPVMTITNGAVGNIVTLEGNLTITGNVQVTGSVIAANVK